MPLDYRLAMAQPVQPGGTLKNILAMGELRDQDRARQQARIDAEQQRQADAIIQQTLTQFPDKPDEAVKELKRRGMHKAAMGFETYLAEHRKKLAENRKAELDAEYRQLEIKGTDPKSVLERDKFDLETTKQKLAAETAFLTNANKDTWLKFLEASNSPETRAAALAAGKLMLGSDPRVESIIATVPEWGADGAEFKAWARNMMIAPKDREEMAATAANRAVDDTRADAQLAVSQGQLAVAQANQRRLAAGGGTTGPDSAAVKALARTVYDNPALYAQMTPTNKDKVATELARLGFDFAKYGGTSKQGRPVLSGDAGRISEFDTSLDDLAVLRETLTGPGSTGAQSQLGAMVPNVVTEFTGIGEGAKQRQAQIDRVKQVIGKALEGGVLRAEDEKKYVKILPTISDPPEVVTAKLKGLEEAIRLRRERLIESLSDAGFDTSRYEARGTTTAAKPADKAYTGEVRETSDGRLLGKVNGQVVELVKSGTGYQVK